MIHVYLQDTQNGLMLLASHPGSDDAAQRAAEAMAEGWMDRNRNRDRFPDADVITAVVVDRTAVADFAPKGPTPT